MKSDGSKEMNFCSSCLNNYGWILNCKKKMRQKIQFSIDWSKVILCNNPAGGGAMVKMGNQSKNYRNSFANVETSSSINNAPVLSSLGCIYLHFIINASEQVVEYKMDEKNQISWVGINLTNSFHNDDGYTLSKSFEKSLMMVSICEITMNFVRLLLGISSHLVEYNNLKMIILISKPHRIFGIDEN
jgi:hypothetical protein